MADAPKKLRPLTEEETRMIVERLARLRKIAETVEAEEIVEKGERVMRTGAARAKREGRRRE